MDFKWIDRTLGRVNLGGGEARGQNWSETKVIVGLDPPDPSKNLNFWHTLAQRGGLG